MASLRALMTRLRTTGLSEAERAQALRAHDQAELLRQLDPRTRIVEVWSQVPPASPPPTLADLNELARSSFDEDHLVVIAALPRAKER